MKYLLKTIPVFIFFILFALGSKEQGRNVPVFSKDRSQFAFPWAGGMNSCQFGKIDLDLDGVKDLVVFDRVGDRIMPFLVVPSGDSYDYKYAPEFAASFPELAHWAVFADYDLDGKVDIFTYSPGFAGMKVYRNTSADKLDFTLVVYPYLTSFQGGGEVNILVTYADYPAIADLDGDGDLDILTFYGLGSFVEKHRNMSMEKYGNADSLDYEKVESCWGYFAEGIESNSITLDTCLRCVGAMSIGHRAASQEWLTPDPRPQTSDLRPQTADRRPPTADRHTGSTFCILDLNGDALPDLLLGDVDYPNLVALYNGGNSETARMTEYDWQYPAGANTVNLFSMPASFYDDVDFDGVKDLIVSPFDPNPFNPENFQSCWLYHNDGTVDLPQFSLRTKSFLQDRMLDFGAGAYPVLFDLESDGLTDLFAGNYGYYDTSYFDQYFILHTEHTGKIAYMRNTGTGVKPAFSLNDRDFAAVSSLDLKGLVPTFGDLDGDGDADMLAGNESGRLLFYENIAAAGAPANFVINDEYYQNIDAGDYSAPVLFDFDEDNLTDLVIGEKGGNLDYYRNTGSTEKPVFTLVTDSLGKINVTDPYVSLDGYSVPFLYRSADQVTYLLVGSEQGKVFFYPGIDIHNPAGKYLASDTLADLLGLDDIKDDFGYRSAPALADLDLDGIPELLVGNFSGGLEYFGKNGGSTVNQVPENGPGDFPVIHIFPNPAYDQIHIKLPESEMSGCVEAFLYNELGNQVFHQKLISSNSLDINTEGIPGGVYILKIIVKDNVGNIKLMHAEKVILLKV